MADGDQVATGIAGLDSILHGGVPRTNVILAIGETGTGKTLLGIEFIYRGITDFDEPGIIVIFETRPDKLIRDAANFRLESAGLAGAEEAANHLYESAGAGRGDPIGQQPSSRDGD